MPNRRDFMKTTAASAVAASILSLESATANEKSAKPVKRQDRPLRLAIVGTGQISPRYLNQAKGNERAQFVATCARTIESAKARAQEYGIGAWFDDYQKMYDTLKPDAAVIATPHTLHAEHSLAALNRGIHVLCEKPMATTWEDCQAMVAAAQKSGVVFLNAPYDATPAFMAALAQLNEATLGAFTGAQANLNFPGAGAARAETYDDKNKQGALFSSVVYSVSTLISLLGSARSVTGLVNTLIPHRLMGEGDPIDFAPPPRNSTKRSESNIEDNVTLLIEWPSGQQATVRGLWGTSFFESGTTIYGRQGTMWLSGNDIVIHSPARPIAGAAPITWNGKQNCYKVPITEVRKNEGLVDHFVDCILKLAQPNCGGEQQLHVHEILFKGLEATKSGRTQELTTSFKLWHEIDPTFFGYSLALYLSAFTLASHREIRS